MMFCHHKFPYATVFAVNWRLYKQKRIIIFMHNYHPNCMAITTGHCGDKLGWRYPIPALNNGAGKT